MARQELTPEYLYADRRGFSHVYIPVGLPRVGKTTTVNKYIDEGYTPICCDDIRRALGTRFDHSLEEIVHATSNIMLRSLVIRGVPVIVDETNVRKDRRKIILDILKEHGATWTFLIFPTPPDEVLRKRCEDTGFLWSVMEYHKKIYCPVEDSELCATCISKPKIIHI